MINPSDTGSIEEFLSHLRRMDVTVAVKGERLVIDAPEGAVTPELRAQIAARKQEILGFLAEAGAAIDAPITATTRNEPAPLSFAQQRMWFLDQLQSQSSAFNSPVHIRFTSPLDLDALAHSICEILQRHDILRTNFPIQNGSPVPVVSPPGPIDLPVDDCSSMEAIEKLEFIRGRMQAEAETPFDIAHDPLIRTSILRCAADDHILLLTAHHIVSDGWSVGVFLHELTDLYKSYDARTTCPLPEPQLQYADFARWQHNTFVGEKLERDLNYWKDVLSGAPDLLALPLDRPRPPVYHYEGGKVRFTISSKLTAQLKKLAEQETATLFMVLLGAYSALLSRMSGIKDIVVGYPIAGRKHKEIESLIGCFVNTLLLRSEFSDDMTFRQVLSQVRSATTHAYDHQDLPFEKLVDEMQPERSLSHNPLFQVVFLFQNVPFELPDFPGMEVLPRDDQQFTPGATFDMTMVMMEELGHLQAELEYNTTLFDQETIERMCSMYCVLLEAAVQQPDRSIMQLEILDTTTRHELIWGRNETKTDCPGDAVSRLFERQVEETPDSIAVECGQDAVTYRELNERANRLARLLQTRGAGRDSIVAIIMERSIDLLAGLLAVLKSGAAYLPIDPNDPKDRITNVLGSSKATLLLTNEDELAERIALPDHMECVDASAIGDGHAVDNLRAHIKGSDPAYVIYTSGSTGEPKGAIVQHSALTNYIWWAKKQYLAGQTLDFPLHTSVAFDLTVTSLYLPLVSGGRVIVYGETSESKVPAILQIVQDRAVDVVKLTPAHLTLLRNLDLKDSGVKKLIVGGEDLRVDLARTIHEAFGGNIEIYNEYGPTEATVGCMIHRYDPALDTATSVPIGVPADNVRIYLLDENRQPVPSGAVGEMYIAGQGIAKGYLHRENLTRERFLPDPFVPDDRMYRTGDLARWRNEGVMEFFGRADQQIKIRGHRIELGEIEEEICTRSAVRECVVQLVQQTTTPPDQDDLDYCVDCGLASNYPGTTFNEQGRCNQCQAYEQYRQKVEPYFKGIDELETLFSSYRQQKRGEYDCIVLFSGGKDSTYVLGRLADMNLKVLAYTLDNGYISEEAKNNIRRVVETLGVDHIFGTTPHMNAIFSDSLTRHSNVCNGCFKTLYTLSMSLAKEKGVPCIVTGLSRGQQFETRLSNFYRADDFCAEAVDDHIKQARKVYHRLDDEVSRRLDVGIFAADDIFDEIQIVDFYRFCDVSLDELYAYLDDRLPWVRPSDTGRSTNCTINDVGIYIHNKQRHYHNYAMPYAWDVRTGHKQRDAALAELDDKIDVDSVRRIMGEIGYDEHARTKHAVEPVLVAYCVTDDELDTDQLRLQLQDRLPETMIPAFFVPLEEMPLTRNGKVDRRALGEIEITRGKVGPEYVPPRTAVEQRLVSIWEDLIGLQRIGVQEDFFRLGGHSLLAAQVASRIAQDLHVELPVATLFDRTTIEELALAISENSALGLEDPDIEDILAEVESMTDEQASEQRIQLARDIQENR